MMTNNTYNVSITGEASSQKNEIIMNDLQDRNSSGDDAASNNDASHKGVNIKTTVDQTVNDASRDEVAGTKVETLTYEKLMRKSAGIGRTKNARKLQSLRDDIRTVQSDLHAQVAELEASVGGIEDDLDRLACKEKIDTLQEQAEKLDKVLGKVQAQVSELLSA
jgi:hypothetical protein